MKKTAPKPAPRFEVATEADATPRPRGRPKKRGRPPKSARQAPPEQATGPVQEARDVASQLAAILPEPDPVIHALLSELLDAGSAMAAEAENNGAWVDAMQGPAGANLKKASARMATTLLPMLPEIDPRVASAVALALSARAFAGAVKAKPVRQLRATKPTTPPPARAPAGPTNSMDTPFGRVSLGPNQDTVAAPWVERGAAAEAAAEANTPALHLVTEDTAATLAAEGGPVA